MGQGITIDVSARIVGYQESLKQLQQALSKVDPGSDIGKSLSKAFINAQQQVKELSKNMFPKAGNELQIDKILGDVDRVGMMLDNVRSMFSGVSLQDLKLDGLTTEISSAIREINTLQSSVTTTMNAGIRDAVSNSTELKSIFTSLGKDITQLTPESGSMALSEGLAAAREEAEIASQALQKTTSKVNELQEQLNNKKANSPFNPDSFNLDTFKNQLQQMNPEKILDKNALANVWSSMIDAVDSRKISEDMKTQLRNSINQAFETLNNDSTTASQFKQTLANLYQQLSGQFNLSDNQIRGILGTTDPNKIIDQLFGISPDALQNAKDQITNMLQPFKASFTKKENETITKLIDEGQLEKATEAAIQAITKAQDKVVKTWENGEAKLTEAKNKQHEAQQNLDTAKQNEKTLDQGTQSYNQVISSLMSTVASQTTKIAQLEATVQQLTNTELGKVQQGGGSNPTAGLKPAIADAQKYKSELNQINSAQTAIGKMQSITQRWFSVYAAVRGVTKAIRSTINTTKELDATITDIAIVTNQSQDQLWGQMPQYTEMARQYGASISGVYKVSQLYYQQGLKQNDVMALSAETLKLARISGLEYSQATDYMTNAVRSFKMEMTDAQTVTDVYSAVAAKSATSVTEIATAMSKTASSAQAVGSSIQNTTAMMAVMIEATRESPENIGSAMKSIISRYGELKENKTGIDEEGEEYSLNKVDKALQSVGLTLHDSEGKFRNFDDVIMELAESWDTIDTNTQRYIATVMAGNRQQSRFLALVSSYQRLKELSAEAADSEDASQMQFLKTIDSIEYKSQQLQTSLQSLYTDSGIQNLIKDVLDGANNIVQTFTSMPKTFDMPLAAIAKFGIQFANIAKIVTTTFGLIKTGIASQIDAIRQKGVKGAQEAANREVEIVKQKNVRIMESEQGLAAYKEARAQGKTPAEAKAYAYGKMSPVYEKTTRPMTTGERIKSWFGNGRGTALAGLGLSIAGSALTMGAMSMGEETQQARNQKAWMTALGSTATGAGMGAMFGIPGMIIGGLVGTVSGLIQAADIANEDAEERAARLQKELETTKNENISKKNEYKNLKNNIDEYERLKEAHLDSAEAAQEYLDKCNAIAEEHPELIQGYDAEGNAIINLAEAYKKLQQAKDDASDSDKKEADAAVANAAEAVAQAEGKLNKQNIGGALDTKGIMENYDLNSIAAQLTMDEAWYAKSPTTAAMGQLAQKITNAIQNDWSGEQLGDLLGEIDVKKILDENREIFSKDNLWKDVYSLYDELQHRNQNVTGETKEEGEYTKAQTQLQAKRNVGAASVASNLVQERLLADQVNNTSAYKYLSEFNNASTLAGRYLAKKSSEYTGEKYFENQSEADFDEINKAIGQFWNNSFTASKKQFENLVNNQGNYTQSETASILESLGIEEFVNGKSNPLYEAIMEYYSSIDTDFNSFADVISSAKTGKRDKIGLGKRLMDNVKTIDEYQQEFMDLGAPEEYAKIAAKSKFTQDAQEHFYQQLGTDEQRAVTSFYNNLLDQVDQKSISEATATKIMDTYVQLQNALTSSDFFKGQEELQQKAQSLLKDSDLTNQEGIKNFLDGLDKLGISLSDLGLTGNDFKFPFPANFSAKAQTFGETMSKQMTDFEKDISSATKGMDLSTASKMADKLGISLSKFRQEGKQFFLDDYSLLEEHYFKTREESITDLQQEQQQELENLSKIDKGLGGEETVSIKDLEAASEWTQQWQDDLDKLFGDDSFTKALSENYNINPNVYKTQLESWIKNREDGETFEAYIARNFGDIYNAYVEASAQALKDNLASSYLSSGQLTRFVETARGVKSTDYKEHYEAAIKQGMTETAADAVAKQQVQAAERWNQENKKIADQIASGNYQNLSDDLMKYQGEIYKQYKGVQTTTANALITAMKGGESQIEVTDENRKYLTDLASQQWITEGTYDTDGQLKSGTLATINTMELMSKSETEFNSYIQGLVASREEKLKLLQEYQDIKYPDKAASISDMISKTELGRAEFQSYLDSIGIEDWTDPTKLSEYETTYGLEFDEKTGKYKQNYDTYIAALRNQLNSILDKESDKYKELSNQLDQAQRNKEQEKEVNKKKALEDIINNYNSIDASAYDSLQSALSLEEWEKIDDYITSKGDGTYKLNIGGLKNAIKNGSIALSNTTSQYLLGLFTSITDDYLKNLTTATSLVTQGTSNQADIQKFIDSAKEFGIAAQDAFSYDSILGAWTLDPQVMADYIRAQGQKLVDDGLLSVKEVNDYINKNVKETLASQIDIKSFLDAENKQGQAREKLTKQLMNAGIWKQGESLLSENWQDFYDEQSQNVEQVGQLLTSSGFITDLLGTAGITIDPEVLKKQAQEQAKANKEANDKVRKTAAEQMIQTIEDGGINAVDAMQTIAILSGKELTSADIESAYRAQVSQIENSFEQLITGPGGIVTGTAKTILETLQSQGKASITALDANNAVINSLTDIAAAYQEYYNLLAKSGEATLESLNNAKAKVLETKDGRDQEQKAIDALGEASGMTYSTFAQLMTDMGIKLTDGLMNSLESSGIIESLGGAKMRIKDFAAFAQAMNWDFDSEEYISAFKSYNDGLIELNQKTEKSIVDEVKSLESAQNGDWINLTQFADAYQKSLAQSFFDYRDFLGEATDKLHGQGQIKAEAERMAMEANQEVATFNDNIITGLNEQLIKYGAILENGILKTGITDVPTDMLGVFSVLSDALDVISIDDSKKAEIKDTFNSMMDSYISAISDGTQGSLKYADFNKLVDLAKSYNKELDYTETAEGLKLTEDSFFSLYNIMAKSNKMMAKKLLPDMKNMSDRYKSLNSVMKEYEESRKKDSKTKQNQQALKDLLSDMFSNPESYNLMDFDLPTTWEIGSNYYGAAKQAYDATKAIGEGMVSIEQFASLAQSLMQSSDKAAQQKGLDMLKRAPEFWEYDSKGNLMVNTRAMGIKNQAKDLWSLWESSYRDFQLEAIDQQKAYNELFYGSKSLDYADIWDEQGDINADNLAKVLTEKTEQAKSINDLLGHFYDENDKTFAELAKNKKLTSEQKEILKQLSDTDWELGNIDQQLLDSLGKTGTGGEITFDESGEMHVKVSKDGKKWTLKYDYEGKSLTQEQYTAAMAAQAEKEVSKLSDVKDNKGKITGYKMTFETGQGTDVTLIMDKGSGGVKYQIGTDGPILTSDQYAAYAFAEAQKGFDSSQMSKESKVTFQMYNKDITLLMNNEVGVEYSVTSGEKTITAENATDLTAALMALGEISQADVAKASGGEERTIRIDGAEYKVILSNGQYTVEGEDSDLAGKIADYLNEQQISADLTNPVEATATQVSISVASGVTPTLDIGDVNPKIKGTITATADNVVIKSSNVSVDTGAEGEEGASGKAIEAVVNYTSQFDKKLPPPKTGTAKYKSVFSNLTAPTLSGVINYTARLVGGAASIIKSVASFGNATGTVGLAHAKSTLMGELGPEMVVSNNRYFIVGQNGPEFVDLADDAIVFNHLQTKSLLEKGSSSIRGKAITNERKAVAYAHGSLNGGLARGSGDYFSKIVTAVASNVVKTATQAITSQQKTNTVTMTPEAQAAVQNQFAQVDKRSKELLAASHEFEKNAANNINLSDNERQEQIRKSQLLEDESKKAQNIVNNAIKSGQYVLIDAAEKQSEAADEQQDAAKKLTKAGNNLTDAGNNLTNTSNNSRNYNSQQESRGIVHPNPAPKLKDLAVGGGGGSVHSGGNGYLTATGTGSTLIKSPSAVLKNYINSGGGGDGSGDAETALKDAKSAVKTFLEDLLSKGIEAIDLSNYEKLPANIASEIQGKIDRNDTYRSFINEYAIALDASMSEVNAKYFEAWQKDLEVGGLAQEQMEALEGLSFFNNGEIGGSADDWVTILGNSAYVGDAVEAGVLEWNAALRQYIVKNKEALEQFMNTKIGNIWNFPDAAIDQAQSVTDEINELLTNAISGEGLSSKDKTRLEELLKKQGYTDSLKFIQTSDNKFLLISSAITDTSKSVMSKTYDALIERIKNITSLISDAFGENKGISNVDATTLHNQLKAAGLSDVKLTLTDKGYIASFKEVQAIYNQIVEKYPSLAAELLKNIANEELTKEQQQWKAEALRNLSKNKDVAETYDALIERVNSIVDALSKAFGDGNHITNVQKVELDKNLAALGMDSIDLTVDSAGYIANFDSVKKGFEALVKLWPEQAANLLEKISNDELTKEQQQWKAEQLAALSKNKLSAETLDAIRERVQNTVDIVKKAIEGTASFVDIEQLKDKLVSDKSFGVSAEEVKEKLKYITTENGNKLTKASYEWLIKVYSKEHADLVDGLTEAMNEAYASDITKNQKKTYGLLDAITSNATYSSRTDTFSASLEGLKAIANAAGVDLETLMKGMVQDLEGNYTFTMKQLEDNGIVFDKKYTKYVLKAGKETEDKLFSAFSDVASEALEKGLGNIDWRNYLDNLTEADIEFGKQLEAEGDLIKFVQLYAEAAHKTVKEVNELYFQAWEKVLSTTAKKAANGMQYYLGGGMSGSSSDWTDLLGDNVKISDLVAQGILSYNETLDTYVATSVEALKQLGLDEATIDADAMVDSIDSLFDTIIETFSKAINEGIGHLEVKQFTENLRLQGVNLDLTFKQTVDGLKLSTESAIALYTELQKVDTIQAQLMFKKLNESLKESNDHYKDATSILARIKELQDNINDAEHYSDEKIKQYKEELSLAEEILAVRATTDDDSFDFANRALPGGLNNALTYAKSWATAWKEFKNAAEDPEKDIIDFQLFYNTATEINKMAGVLGESIDFFGYSLDGKIDNLDNLITHAANSLGSSLDGSQFGVKLSKFGDDLTSGMSDYANSADTALHTMAKAQIKVLDGLIAMFEVIVAMEEFEGADLNANGLLDFNEVFNLTGLAENAYSSAVIFNSKFSDAAQVLLDTINSNDEYKEIANKIKLNGHTLYEIFDDAADGIRDILDVPAETYAQMVSSLYELLKSGDFDLDDIYNSMKEAFLTNQSGYEGMIEIGNIVFNVKYKATLTKLDDGTYQTPSGAIYTNEKDAAQGLLLESIGAKDIEFDETTCTSHGTIKVGQSTIEVQAVTDSSGAVTYNAPSGTYTSLDAAIEGEWKAARAADKEMTLSLEEWKIDQKITVVPVVSPKLAESDLDLDQNQINAAIGKTYDEIKAEWDAAKGNKEAELHFEATYGIAFNDNTTEADWARFKELAGIETKNIELNASINVIKVEGVLNQLLSTNPEDKTISLNIEAPTDEAEKAVNLFKQTVDSLTGTVNVDANISEAKSKLQTIIDTINNIDTSIDIDVNVHQNGELPSGSSSATGTVGSALAAGTQTLMGELGPELYVTNGRYHLAGENGAEFVNLPDDAIVFNHLQTQRLLQNGSTGRGKPVTNERKAVAMARGSGPAAASARQTLATLKQMRAMWQSLADMSVTELAGMTTDKENIATWIQQVEKWYTLLQKIATLEKKITQEQKIRAALQSKLVAAGDLYAESQIKSLQATSEQLKLEQELAQSYLDEFNSRRKELNENGPFSRFYTFDENGQIVYRENGLEELTELFNPQYENNGIKYTAEEQVALAKAYGLGDFMKKDSEGKTLVQEENESSSEFAVRQLDALKYSMDKQQADLQSYYDSWYDHTNTALDLEESRNQILQEIRDNQIELEDKVLQAVEDREQAIIDKLSDEREALSKANENYIKSLQDTLDKERKLYEANENEQEVKSLQRRLSILQRSGGSQSEISNLQKELQEKTKDLYFDAQEEQINTLQDASDAQLEKLDKQIDLMTESLEYAKENGLLWNDVYKVMSGTSEEITAFLTTNMSDWKSKSTLAQEQEQKTLLFIAQQFETYRKEDQEKLFATPNNITDDLEGLRTATNIDINEKTEKDYNKINKEAEIRAANGSSGAGTSTSGSKKTTTSNNTLAQSAKEQKANPTTRALTAQEEAELIRQLTWAGELNTYITGAKEWMKEHPDDTGTAAAIIDLQKQLKDTEQKIKDLRNRKEGYVYEYAHGGLVNYTGLAQVHGTDARPEAFMNADEVQMWKQDILGSGSHSLTTQLVNLRSVLDAIESSSSNIHTTVSEGVTIEHAEVNMNVDQIANDYDARRAGANALDEMLKIARKAGNNSIRR